MTENKDVIIEEVTVGEDTGKVNISDEVVATIAGIAATEIPGVTGMYGSAIGDIAEKLGAKKSPGKGVKVSVDETGAVIDVYIVVEFGKRIPELAWEVQENVKSSQTCVCELSLAEKERFELSRRVNPTYTLSRGASSAS